MNAAKPQKASKAKSRKLPPVADYSDEVSDEQFARIQALVPQDTYRDAEIISGPAW